MWADLLDLPDLDAGHRAGPQPSGFHNFGSHDKRRLDLRHAGARVDREPRASCAEILSRRRPPATNRLPAVLANVGQSDVREEAGEHRRVDVVRRCGTAAAPEVEFTSDLFELGVQVLPFPYSQEMQELVSAQPPKSVP